MSFVRADRLLHSTSFRLSLVLAVLVVAGFGIAGAAAWFVTRDEAEREVRERIQLEMTTLQVEVEVESLEAAVLDMKSHLTEDGALGYRFVDASGQLILGNLEVSNPADGWMRAVLKDTRAGRSGSREFLLLTQPTADGSRLTIGGDFEKARSIRYALLMALAWVAIPSLIFIIVSGFLIASLDARRIADLSRAMESFGRGDLAVRAPQQGKDEISRIGAGLNEMAERIDRLIANTRRVSTAIAHDLRTPLAHIRQDLETGARTADPTTLDSIRGAQARIDDILRVFQAILRLAEIDAGAGSARDRFTPVDLAAIVERVTDAYRPDIEASGRRLLIDGSSSAVVSGDGDLIALALANLLENAMRHTPDGSDITVRTQSRETGRSLIVEDRGPGIPADARSRVLEPFARLDASRSTEGAGLGLSIVAAIARLHGAVLKLEDANPGLRVSVNWNA